MDSPKNPSSPAESQTSAPSAATDTPASPIGEATPVTPAAADASANTRSETAPAGDTPARETPASTPAAARTAPATGASKTTSTPTASVNKGVSTGVAAKAPGATTRPAAAAQTAVSEPPINRTRRRIVWAAIAGFVATTLLMFLRFFMTRSVLEPSNVFRVGRPDDYAFGVDTKWQQQYRIWVVKTTDRLFVISAVCTHLGCTPDWKSSENKFKCPCHGSGYDSEGVNFEGPAPRPMDRAHVELDAEGQIVVDKGRLYTWPKGEPSEFNEEGSFIPLGG